MLYQEGCRITSVGVLENSKRLEVGGNMVAVAGLNHQFYKAKRLSSVCSVFLRLLLDALTGGLVSAPGADGEALSAAFARSDKNLSNSEETPGEQWMPLKGQFP